MKPKIYSLKLTKIELNILKKALGVYVDSEEFKRVCFDCEKRFVGIVSQIKTLERDRRANGSRD